MNIVIRRMTASDVVQVADIEKNVFSEPWPEHEFQKAVTDPNYVWLVAEYMDGIAGYAGAVCVTDEADITNVAVSEDFRRYGIASQLIQSLVTVLTGNHISMVFLEVRESNVAAIALYNNMGFYQVGRRPDFYRKPPEAALLMRKDLE